MEKMTEISLNEWQVESLDKNELEGISGGDLLGLLGAWLHDRCCPDHGDSKPSVAYSGVHYYAYQ